MKAERSQEIQENDLAKKAGRTVKVMQLPDIRRKVITRAIVGIGLALLIALAIWKYIDGKANDRIDAASHLAQAREKVELVKNQPAFETIVNNGDYLRNILNNAELAKLELDAVEALSSDKSVLAQVKLLRGDISYALGMVPILPPVLATSKPVAELKQTRDEYFSAAIVHYNDVVQNHSTETLAVATARFSLAAIEENRSHWDEATKIYESIRTTPSISPILQALATERQRLITRLRNPFILEKTESSALVPVPVPAPATNPTTEPSTTKPATTSPTTSSAAGAATVPTTSVVVPTSGPATTKSTSNPSAPR